MAVQRLARRFCSTDRGGGVVLSRHGSASEEDQHDPSDVARHRDRDRIVGVREAGRVVVDEPVLGEVGSDRGADRLVDQGRWRRQELELHAEVPAAQRDEGALVAIVGNRRRTSDLGGDAPGEDVRSRLLAMGDEDSVRARCQRADPVEQIGGVRVDRELAVGDDLSAHGHQLAAHLQVGRALGEGPASGAGRLIAGEDDRVAVVGQHPLQVVQHPPTVGHARGADDDRWCGAASAGQRHRFLCRVHLDEVGDGEEVVHVQVRTQFGG
jgi:hypothetical protein